MLVLFTLFILTESLHMKIVLSYLDLYLDDIIQRKCLSILHSQQIKNISNLDIIRL